MEEKIIPTESLLQYYKRTGHDIPSDLLQHNPRKGHFNVREATQCTRKTPFNRRDYFKICLTNGRGKGSGTLQYNDQEIHLDQPCLILTNPSVPASIEINSTHRYHCLFDAAFIEGYLPPEARYASPLFNPALYPVILLTEKERERLTVYYEEMQLLINTDYSFKWEMIRNLLQLLIHESIRLQQMQIVQPLLVRDRLVNDFFVLLNQQFPVDSPETQLALLTPAYLAGLLHVHVNHLNSVVKKHTGKTTRQIIHERVITEAKTLLRNTNWNISEIAYSLGFEYPSHFNKYFKQFATVTPMEFRAS